MARAKITPAHVSKLSAGEPQTGGLRAGRIFPNGVRIAGWRRCRKSESLVAAGNYDFQRVDDIGDFLRARLLQAGFEVVHGAAAIVERPLRLARPIIVARIVAAQINRPREGIGRVLIEFQVELRPPQFVMA